MKGAAFLDVSYTMKGAKRRLQCIAAGCAHWVSGGGLAVSGARLRKGGDCESAELIKEDPARVEVPLSTPLTALNSTVTFVASRGCVPPDVCPLRSSISSP